MTTRPIETVLVANRGEIAIRIIRACHALGLRAVAVYSDADRDAPHVRAADAAVRIGAAPARESYLSIEALLEAARRSGADAVHPGYGFLAENAGFARACIDSGLVFIGPGPGAMESMGLKSTAKAIAARAGVPVVPGYHGADQDEERLLQEAKSIGFPVLIKASAGGGGRGMRRVDNAEGFAEALSLARAEASAAFGDGTLLLEKWVARPRHVEVQVLGDKHGNRVHLFERDCSLQRNHQKLVEEAPAPNLTAELRASLLRWSLDLAAELGYDSAGTVEFLVDQRSGEAWFLEMNTRLQVEHPVTEAITGIDIVAWQIRIAAGEALDFGQDDVAVNGWAMEARIAAEDPAGGYSPCTGALRHWRIPPAPGIRVDAGVVSGSVIGHHYDSMLAKLIAHGRDRDEARRRLSRALAAVESVGAGVNTQFLADLVALPDFAAGRPHTALINETWPDGWSAPPADPRGPVEAALACHLRGSAESTMHDPWHALGSWRITAPAGRHGLSTYSLRSDDGRLHTIAIEGDGDRFNVIVTGGETLVLDDACLKGDCLHYVENDLRREVEVSFGDPLALLRAGGAETYQVLTPEQVLLNAATRAHTEGDIVAPMPGALVEVKVSVGQAVRSGDALCVMEAMKLYQTLAAPFDGTVTELRHRAGDSVSGGALLAVITPADTQTSEPENTAT